jgi:hypothetical protein
MLHVGPKGRRLVDDYEQLKTARLVPILAGFHPEELGQLATLLERFSVALLKAEDSNGVCLRCAAYVESDCPVSRVRGFCPYQKARGGRVNELNTEGVDRLEGSS